MIVATSFSRTGVAVLVGDDLVARSRPRVGSWSLALMV